MRYLENLNDLYFGPQTTCFSHQKLKQSQTGSRRIYIYIYAYVTETSDSPLAAENRLKPLFVP